LLIEALTAFVLDQVSVVELPCTIDPELAEKVPVGTPFTVTVACRVTVLPAAFVKVSV
jgi:hypothetical protein